MTTIPSIKLIWDLYVVSRSQVWELRAEVLDCLAGRVEKTDKIDSYVHLQSDEVRDMFDRYLDEMDKLIILDLFTALEGHVRADFDDRVRQRKRDSLSKSYRLIEKSGNNQGRTPFEDLFVSWKEHRSACGSYVGRIKGLWHFRNWLAHGRWWVTKKGPMPDVNNVKRSVEGVLNCLGIPFF
ncbi:MAG: hypothetical protein HQL83_00695 [Magnetococcales bacterium]|nr:hypothetical protein [Magnetococcales bacterium]